MLHELKIEEFTRLKNGRNWGDIKSGDSIQVERLPYATAKDAEVVKGVVIAKTNRASDSTITLANVSKIPITLLFVPLNS